MDETTVQQLNIRFATQAEFDQIHELNHEVFAAEIPQHQEQENARLVDAFHDKNTYLLASINDELVGMVCYNAERPFSLDKKMEALDTYLPAHQKLVEVRLFAVKKELRKQGVGISMLQTLIPHLIEKGFDLGVISASLKELELYHNIGATAFGKLVGSEEVLYQPMYFHIRNLKGSFQQ